MVSNPPSVLEKPPLKWPGGKYRVLGSLLPLLGSGSRLIEPFVGSGTVFLNSPFKRFFLADTNADLVEMYKAIKADPLEFIELTRPFFSVESNTADCYYALRSAFNQSTAQIIKTALFMYLNKHCYNGLVRYNASGGFNSPFGAIKSPYFPEREILRFSERLKIAEIGVADFSETMRRAKSGDVVYCDPPYQPLSKSASFTSYSAGGFGWDRQVELAELAAKTARKGVKVVVSNHDTPEIRRLYASATLHFVEVQRQISRNGANRTKAREIIAVW